MVRAVARNRQMQITFYGVRGSIPSPGPATERYGGNTSCVHVRTASGADFVLDAGTGMRRLGEHLAIRDTPISVLVTHSHWDHIQGFPFFAPIFQPDRQVLIARSLPDGDSRYNGVLEQMNGHNFPVPHTALPSRVRYLDDIRGHFAALDVLVDLQALNHPGGGHAYRIACNGVSIAYVTDNELDPPDAPSTRYAEWVEWCRGVDVLIHDAQYLPGDMPHKHGFGHSLIHQVRELARDAEVGCLALYHHDPARSDAELDEIRLASEAWFRLQRSATLCLVAREGMRITLNDRAPTPAGRIAVDRAF